MWGGGGNTTGGRAYANCGWMRGAQVSLACYPTGGWAGWGDPGETSEDPSEAQRLGPLVYTDPNFNSPPSANSGALGVFLYLPETICRLELSASSQPHWADRTETAVRQCSVHQSSRHTQHVSAFAFPQTAVKPWEAKSLALNWNAAGRRH